MYEDYNDTEIGALECEEIEGEVLCNADVLLQYAKEFEQSQFKTKMDKDEEIKRYY